MVITKRYTALMLTLQPICATVAGRRPSSYHKDAATRIVAQDNRSFHSACVNCPARTLARGRRLPFPFLAQLPPAPGVRRFGPRECLKPVQSSLTVADRHFVSPGAQISRSWLTNWASRYTRGIYRYVPRAALDHAPVCRLRERGKWRPYLLSRGLPLALSDFDADGMI
jgi:hypothetical protein